MKRKHVLDRGLDKLLKGISTNPQEDTSENFDAIELGQFQTLPIEYLQKSPFQPRRVINEESLQELADSIKAQGILQPILARKIAPRHYEIIAGERRWRAAQLADVAAVPVLVKDIPNNIAAALALVENIQREDLNPLEEANAMQRLIDDFKMTHTEVAQTIGRSRTAVTNLLRLLNLVSDVRDLLYATQIEMGHARALLPLKPPQQKQVAKMIVAKKLSVRETERLVQRWLHAPAVSKPPFIDPDIQQLENHLSEKLCAQVTIHHNTKGQGNLIIHYNSLDELDGILEHVG